MHTFAKNLIQPQIEHSKVVKKLPAQEQEVSPVSSASFAYDFSRIAVHSHEPVRLQPKLTVSSPGDEYEQEADRVSQQVMQTPEPHLQVACACAGACPKCQAGQPGQGQARLQAKRVESGNREPTQVPPIIHEAPGSSGHPIDLATRAFMEPRFGHDFSKVRVHTDYNAAEMARELNARAFTVGNDIYFASRQYAPGTFSGNKLLAHELAHTIQQSRGGSHAVRGALGWAATIALSFAPSSIQRKEEVLKPEVRPENPLKRFLDGKPPGLTIPIVNGVEISSANQLHASFPRKFAFAKGSAPNTCKVDQPIDVHSKAKIITASDPEKDGWQAPAPYDIIRTVAKITDKDCAAKKGNIKVRLVADMGNAAFAKKVRQAEGEHEAVITDNHNKYVKPYHDLVTSKVGSNVDINKCVTDLAKAFDENAKKASLSWMKDWNASVDNLDRDPGPHKIEVSFKVVGKCDEVLGTVKGKRGP